jgi:hypothetical protein
MLLLAGCDVLPKKEWQPPHVPEFQRFIPLPENHPGDTLPGAVALDTATGKLCKTYKWSVPNMELPSCAELTSYVDADEILKQLKANRPPLESFEK